MRTTSRQEVALLLYYVEGWSHRRIGQALHSNPGTVYRLIERGRQRIIQAVDEEGGNALPLVRVLLAANESVSCTRHIGRALARQEELLDALQLRMEQRAEELAMYEQWLDSGSSSPSHVKRNPYDQWEMRYLRGRKGEPLPTSAYNAATAAGSCAMNGRPCELGCAGCRR